MTALRTMLVSPGAARAGLWSLSVVMAVAVVPAASAPTASAAVREGRSVDGTRFRLSGKQLAVTLPRGVVRGSRVRVGCGSQSLLGRATTAVERIYLGHRRWDIRLRRDVSAGAEWCRFETNKRNVDARRLLYGAVTLRPRLAPVPRHLRSGPGIREAFTTDTDGNRDTDGFDYGGFAGDSGAARFLLDGSVLTVRLRARSARSDLVRIVCVKGTGPEDEELLGYRTVVLPARGRVVTADLGGNAEPEADYCLIEGVGDRSGDIAAAAFHQD